MSAVGAVICNSYQETGSYLFWGSHKALFKNKDETNKKKACLLKPVFQHYLANFAYETLQ